MRIIVITQYFWPENFRINDLVRGLVERGHQITVLTGIPNYPDGRYYKGYGITRQLRQDYYGAQVIRFPLIPRGKGGGLRLFLNYISFALSSSVGAPFLYRGKADIIFVFEPSPVTVGFPALVLKRLRSIPIIFWIQDPWPESLSATGAIRSKRILFMVEQLVRTIYKHCDFILGTSRAYAASVERLLGDTRRFAFYPQSVEECYQPVVLEADAPERNVIPPGFCIMFAGNIGAAQDFDTILRAAEELRDVHDIHWVIIGDGRKRAWVNEQVKRRQLSKTVHLIGKYPVTSMPRFFSLADVMLVTLRKEPIFALTIPGKVQSYLACAKPVLAVLEGEGAQVIEEAGAGISTPPEDAEALTNAVVTLYRMPKSRLKEMGMKGKRYFESTFDRTMLIDKLEGWMRELVFNRK